MIKSAQPRGRVKVTRHRNTNFKNPREEGAMKVSITVKRAVILLMTMALAVVFVACQAAAPKPADPEPGPAGPAGEPAPKLPYLTTGFPDVPLAETGSLNTATVDLAGHFTDPHNGELTYAASSAPAGVVSTSVSGSTLTLTAVKEGAATVTVKATNKDGESAFNPGEQFTVTVTKTMAPRVADGGIPNQTLYKDDGAKMIALTDSEGTPGIFMHDSAITYSVSSSPDGVVTAVEAEGILTLTPLVKGETIVTVIATADTKSTDPVTFAVDVMAGSEPVAPMAEGKIEAQTLMVGGDPITIDVEPFFSDADSDTLMYNASSSMKAYATASASGSIVMVNAVAEGMATITVTATDDDGLMADQMFEVTVEAAKEPEKPDKPKPEPEPENMAPTVSRHIEDIELRPEGTLEIELDAHFSDPDGDVLIYEITGHDTDVVMATLNGRSLMVLEAKMAGSTDVTVTATDPGGLMTSDEFIFTVDMSCPTSVTLDPSMADGNTDECVLPTGYSMRSGDMAKVRVEEKHGSDDNVWVIIGLEKTKDPVIVYILDAEGDTHTEMSVTVLNQKPKRTTEPSPTSATNLTQSDKNGVVASGTGEDTASAVQFFVTQDLDLTTYFEDDDGDDLKYKVNVSNNVALVKVDKDDFAVIVGDTGETKIVLDVLRQSGDTLALTVDAYDNDGAKATQPVVFTINTKPPVSRTTYVVEQYRESGNISDVKIGNRLTTGHRIKVVDSDSTDSPKEAADGFIFSKAERAKFAEAKMVIPSGTDNNATSSHASEYVAAPSTDVSGVTHKQNAGLDYYTIRTSGPIAAKFHGITPSAGEGIPGTADLSANMLDLEVEAKAVGMGVITITYHVWVRSEKNGDVEGTDADAAGDRWATKYKTITVTVDPCTKFGECA